ncbi:hypothetical protein [Sorangium sp. So ce131]|uniref:hypothetical protein n=1 Tax=Sorangium sp. So ce131 TaxID=3133282 RepID=UPI003F641DE5
MSLLASAAGCGGRGGAYPAADPASAAHGDAVPSGAHDAYSAAPAAAPRGAAFELGTTASTDTSGASPGAFAPASPSPPPGAFGDSSVPAPSAERAEGAARRAPSSQIAPEPIDRPGLGTEWGETRVSRISTTPFLRADVERPFAVASLFYNDAEGARAMAAASGFRRTSPQAFTLAGGAVAVGLRGESGGFLSGFVAGEKSHVVGEAGQRYSIVLRNLTPIRIECVVSVDGLDVLDGQPAAFSKRGYLIDPDGELEIDGFRQSLDTVAAFRFGSVRGSYANQKHGDTRNVGVIGVALFHERGATPWTPAEVRRREDANPFPGQFATPPGR